MTESLPRLGIIVASVRDGRAGLPIAEWFLDAARRHGAFVPELIDLKAVALPLLDEPHHPRLRKYTRESTHAWSRTVAALEAVVIVTAEYNHGIPPALVNALDHVSVEWNYKAAGFVSYGGQSGGMRAVQMTKPMLSALKMVPIVEAVAIPFFTQQMDEGRFNGNDAQAKAAEAMLTELARWTTALRTLRAPASS